MGGISHVHLNMTYKLIMLPQPILVSMKEPIVERSNDCFYSFETSKIYSCKQFNSAISCYKIIAGIEGLPSLDISAIAEEIGWVDVQKLSIDLGLKYYIGGNYDFENGVRKGILEYQYLNEKKFSEEDIREVLFEAGQTAVFSRESCINLVDRLISTLKKPKVYNIEVEMECVGWETSKDAIIKVTNNTIKVTKILE